MVSEFRKTEGECDKKIQELTEQLLSKEEDLDDYKKRFEMLTIEKNIEIDKQISKNQKLENKKNEMRVQFDKMLQNTLMQMDRKIKLANDKFENEYKAEFTEG
mmetsp:Transcript_88522/g.191656  ORF Transcript_88522/g.191656 Transcript_88522/m.191656 type:complete len:103 (+) Transcript_88522:260-568(+)